MGLKISFSCLAAMKTLKPYEQKLIDIEKTSITINVTFNEGVSCKRSNGRHEPSGQELYCSCSFHPKEDNIGFYDQYSDYSLNDLIQEKGLNI
jgi:hypothetical protein